MTPKQLRFKIKGMQRDVGESSFTPDFAFENMNIRISTNEDNGLLNIINEKGTLEVPNINVSNILGYAVIEDQIVLFSHSDRDYIYLLYKTDDVYQLDTLFSGDLNFDLEHPIETLIDIENENIKKIYWVDRKNQPRVINIKADIDPNNTTQFDFVQPINRGYIEVEQSENAGAFNAGVIQYAFTYFNKYGAESSIVDVSPIYYIQTNNRGLAPNTRSSNAFKITLTSLDDSWEYIRLYSILRTSLDGVPEIRKVVDLKLSDIVSYIDTGNTGEYIDPTDILYKGGDLLIASTLTAKDNTLFLGDLDIKNTEVVDQELKDFFINEENVELSTYVEEIELPVEDIPDYNGEYNSGETIGKYYQYTVDLHKNTFNSRHFKTNEYYRLGVQLQDIYGKWSNPIWCGDRKIDIYPKIKYHYNAGTEGNYVGYKTVEELSGIELNIGDIYTLLDSGTVLNTPCNKGDHIKISYDYTSLQRWSIKFQYRRGTDLATFIGYIHTDPEVLKDTINTGYHLYDNSDNEIQGDYINQIEEGEYIYHSDTLINEGVSESGDFTIITDSIIFGTTEYAKKAIEIVNADNWQITKEILCVNKFQLQLKKFDSLIKYNKIRPVIVYPEESERECVYQGVLCPTVYNVKDRNENGPFAQSSWFTRPINLNADTANNTDNRLSGMWAEFRHNKPLVGFSRTDDNATYGSNVEIAGSYNVSAKPGFTLDELRDGDEDTILSNYTTKHANDYFVDNNIVTLHSPDIEFNKNIANIDLSKYKLRIIGNVPITASKSDYNINAPINAYSLGAHTVNIGSFNKSVYAFRHLINANLWKVKFPDNKETSLTIYPWMSNTMYNTDDASYDLKSYRLGNLLYSHNTDYGIGNAITYDNIDAKILGVHNNYITRFNNGKYYYSDIDRLHIMTSDAFYGSETSDPFETPNALIAVDKLISVPITYKSTPHIAIDLGSSEVNSEITQQVLPSSADFSETDGVYPFWDIDKEYNNNGRDSHDFANLSYGFLWLAELYRDYDVSKFGGNSEYALQNNLWLPCGKAVPLTLKVLWKEGDTYYQRYDHIKTLPRNNDDLNGITSIISFMCESRNNIDSRYDIRDKVVNDMLAVNEDNHNKLNEVYNQQNNIFTYRILDNKFNIQNYPSSIVWSKAKFANSDIDTWTNLNMASSLDLDRDKGAVNSLKIFNDNILAFQDKAISQILFNSRVQINTSDGVPIEISNSNKVEGKRYITNSIGCKNKHSICESNHGIYFIDDYNKALYLFNGQFNNLGEAKSFQAWIKNNVTNKKWDPLNFNNITTFKDPINNEILFVNKDYSLAYNESLEQFTSFYSYNGVPYMIYNGEDNLIIKNNKLWLKNKGDYNMFFGQYKPFYVTVIANDNTGSDKIFNAVEFRSDSWNNDKLLQSTYDTLKVWNEYQEGSSTLKFTHGSPSTLKRKFRVWRALIPRDRFKKRDRIRNPWLYVKLSKEKINTNKTVLHDILVNYYD